LQQHRFFHADRSRSLSPGQTIELDENGHSKFGALYWPTISTKNLEDMYEAELREALLERMRRETSFAAHRPSRLSVLFGSLTIEDAIWHAQNVLPPVEHEVPIYEIWSRDFATLDLNWLDYESPTPERRLERYRSYWWGEISNHNPPTGPRRPPRLEVLISLPVVVGELVAHAPPSVGGG
jgi:hypothetical protein